MKKLSQLYIACLIYNIVIATTNLQCATVAKSEVVNLVIFNDYIEKSKRPFPLIASMLGQALCDNQLVLCTKSLWHTLQSINDQILTFNDQNGVEHKKLFTEFQKIKPLINEYQNDHAILFKKIQKITRSLESNPYWNSFSSELIYHTSYEIIKARSYLCKEVNEDYILFIPRELLTKPQPPIITAIAQKKHYQTQDFIIGMSFSRLRAYDYLDQKITPPGASPVDLATTLNSIALKPLLWKEFADTIHLIIPKVNVLLFGHGAFKPIKIAEMPEPIIESLLKTLNNSFETKSLTIISCFAGGVIQKTIDTFKNKHFFESLTYPILLGAGLFTTFRQNKGHIVINNAEEILNSTYNIEGSLLYGPEKKWNNHGQFTQFFTYLNSTKDYSIAKKPYKFKHADFDFSSEYEYTVSRPEYAKAAQIFSNMGNPIAVRLQNIFLIRFPNTATWTKLINIHSTIKEINWIDVATEPLNISIPRNIQDVFLKTQYVTPPIIIKGDLKNTYLVPTIIHKQLLQVDYYLKKLITINDYTIADLAKRIFEAKTVRYFVQPFAIAIKELQLGNNKYDNVLFLTEGNNGGSFGRDRSAFWNWNKKLFCTYSQHGKDFGIMWNITGIEGETLTENNNENSILELDRVRKLLPEIKRNAKNARLLNLEQVQKFIHSRNFEEIKRQQEYRKEQATKEIPAPPKAKTTVKKEMPAPHAKEEPALLISALELASLLR